MGWGEVGGGDTSLIQKRENSASRKLHALTHILFIFFPQTNATSWNYLSDIRDCPDCVISWY